MRLVVLFLCGCAVTQPADSSDADPTDTEAASDTDEGVPPDRDETSDTDGPDETQPPADTDVSSDTDTPEDTDAAGDPLAIVGNYTDTTGGEHTISESLWVIDYGPMEEYIYEIVRHDNSTQTVIAQNGASNPGGEAGLWSRFDWHMDGGDLWVCQTASTAATQAAAEATPAADSDDLSTAGCSPFGWWQLD